MNAARRDEEVQEAATALFLGVAPERRLELEDLWKRYGPCFELHGDDGPDGCFVLKGGLFKFVRFNHRAMRAFWLGGFVGWEGYRAVHAVADGRAPDFSDFNTLVDAF